MERIIQQQDMHVAQILEELADFQRTPRTHAQTLEQHTVMKKERKREDRGKRYTDTDTGTEIMSISMNGLCVCAIALVCVCAMQMKG
jgi:hypothetical protein